MSRGVKIRVDWYEVRTWLVIAGMWGVVVMGFTTIVGVAAGLPWPPRFDDFFFAMFILGVVCPLAWLACLVLQSFFAALRTARTTEEDMSQAPPSFFSRERRITGSRAAADAADLPPSQAARLEGPR